MNPNLFLVGAPKCGTTSMARYLADHPKVFMSTPKEPNYFARSLATEYGLRHTYDCQRDFECYLDLFRSANDSHCYRGEASTRYLRCHEALNEIRSISPKARIIVMVRDPVDLIQSWHAQKLSEMQETEADLETALVLEESRSRGENLPARLKAKDALLYTHIASIGSQIEHLLEIVTVDQVHLVVMDDLRDDPISVYRKVLAFLQLEDDKRRDFSVHNPRRHSLGTRVRDLFGLEAPPGATTSLSPQLESRLRERLCGEVEKLERLLDRDLGRWKKVGRAT